MVPVISFLVGISDVRHKVLFHVWAILSLINSQFYPILGQWLMLVKGLETLDYK